MAFRNNGSEKTQPALNINAKNDHLEYTSTKNLQYIEFKKTETKDGPQWFIGLSFEYVRGFIADSAFIQTIRERDLATVDKERKKEGRNQYKRKFEGNSEEPGAKFDEYEVEDITRSILLTGNASYNYFNSGNIYCHFKQPSAAHKEIVDFLSEIINNSDLNLEEIEKLIEFCQLPFPYEPDLIKVAHNCNAKLAADCAKNYSPEQQWRLANYFHQEVFEPLFALSCYEHLCSLKQFNEDNTSHVLLKDFASLLNKSFLQHSTATGQIETALFKKLEKNEELLWKIGQHFQTLGNYYYAKRCFNQIIQNHPHYADANLALAKSLSQVADLPTTTLQERLEIKKQELSQLLFAAPKHDSNFEILFELSEQISRVNKEIKELGAKLGFGLFAKAPIDDPKETASHQSDLPGLNAGGL